MLSPSGFRVHESLIFVTTLKEIPRPAEHRSASTASFNGPVETFLDLLSTPYTNHFGIGLIFWGTLEVLSTYFRAQASHSSYTWISGAYQRKPGAPAAKEPLVTGSEILLQYDSYILYIYIYVYVYIYMQYVDTYIYANVRMDTYIYIYIHIYIHVCMYVYIYICMCIHIHVICIYIYVCTRIYRYTYIHSFIYIYTHVCI